MSSISESIWQTGIQGSCGAVGSSGIPITIESPDKNYDKYLINITGDFATLEYRDKRTGQVIVREYINALPFISKSPFGLGTAFAGCSSFTLDKKQNKKVLLCL